MHGHERYPKLKNQSTGMKEWRTTMKSLHGQIYEPCFFKCLMADV